MKPEMEMTGKYDGSKLTLNIFYFLGYEKD